MGLILCASGVSEKGYAVRDLNLKVYTLEELCYCLSHYPLLFQEDFPGEALLKFLSEDLGETSLASRLLSTRENGGDAGRSMLQILESSGIYGAEELQSLREALKKLKDLPEAVQKRERADLLFRLNRLGRALTLYEEIRKETPGRTLSSGELQEILFQEGCILANLFRFPEAENRFSEALRLDPGAPLAPEIRKMLYFLARFSGENEAEASEQSQSAETEDADAARWAEEYETAIKTARESDEVKASLEAFYGDPVQRRNKAALLVEHMKKDYLLQTEKGSVL